MSNEPTIVNPQFDASTHVDTIEVGAIGHDAFVEPVHPKPADGRTADGIDVVDAIVAEDVEPQSIIPVPDIARNDDEPSPPAPENLAKPMM